MKSFLLRCWPLLMMLATAGAARADCLDALPGARLSGSGEFSILGFHLYKAELWSANLPADYQAPFALLLTYEKSITRAQFVSAGLAEMKRLGGNQLSPDTLERWHGEMDSAFVDVTSGDRLCGLFMPGIGVRFFANGKPTASINDPEFALAFFGIWLDPHTRASGLRAKLLGVKP
jgi:Chalcone isomerase-like